MGLELVTENFIFIEREFWGLNIQVQRVDGDPN